MNVKHLVIVCLATLTLGACSTNMPQHNERATYRSMPANIGVGAGIGAGIGVGTMALTGGNIIAGGAVGAGTGALIGHHIRTPAVLIASLRDSGVQIIQLGDNLRIIIPSDQLFNATESEIAPSRYPVLTRIAMLLQYYGDAPINVEGFTDNVMSPENNQRLAQKQAQTVASYLWSEGVELQRLKIKGFGEKPDVANNQTVEGSSDNRRIEIKVRKVYG